MPRIGVAGHRGTVGALLSTRLREQGHEVVAVDGSAAPQGLPEVAVVVGAVPRLAEQTPRLARLAAEHGAHYVDCSLEQGSVAWAVGPGDDLGRGAGVGILSGGGLAFGLGNLLTVAAAAGRPAPAEVHVSYIFPDRGGLLGLGTPGVVASLGATVGRRGQARAAGALVGERVGDARWLAWFPRPVGPHHAVGVPGGEALTVPMTLPSATTVRTYLALPTWIAEIVQLSWGAAAAWDRARRALQRGLAAAASAPDPAVRSERRWACVAEVRGPDGVGRAWANGRDPHAVTATMLARAAGALATGGVATGGIAPARIAPAPDQLDDLAAATGLRWSVVRPEPPARCADG